MSWEECEAELHKPEHSDAAFQNKYVVSLITTVVIAAVLIMVRPWFVLSAKTNGVHQPHLAWLRIGLISVGLGAIVLFSPHIVAAIARLRAT